MTGGAALVAGVEEHRLVGKRCRAWGGLGVGRDEVVAATVDAAATDTAAMVMRVRVNRVLNMCLGTTAHICGQGSVPPPSPAQLWSQQSHL